MRVLIAFQGQNENCYGMAPLGWALRTAGHEVWVAGQPEATDLIADTGLTVIPIGRNSLTRYFRNSMSGLAGRSDPAGFDAAFSAPEDLGWDRLKQWYRRAVPGWWKVINEPMLADLTAFCEEWRPDLVLWEQGTYAAPLAARASGAAHARVVWNVDLYAWLRGRFLGGMPEQPEREREDLLARWLGSRAEARGFAFSEELTHGQFTIDCLPRSLGLPADPATIRLPVRYVPYGGRAILPGWLRDDPERPRIGVCLDGVEAEPLIKPPLSPQALIEALGELDVEVVASVSDRVADELPEVPGNVRLAASVPAHELAPACSAMINYGDPGAVRTALLYGLPQLIVPAHDFEAPLLAGKVTDYGAGLTVGGGDGGAAGVREQVARLLDDHEMRAQAGRLQQEMLATPAPNDVTTEIEELTAKHRIRR